MKTVHILLFLALAGFVRAAADFVPPIGIPDPAAHFGGFEPIRAPKPDTTTHCPGWHREPPVENTRAAGFDRDAYFVDNTHPDATDSGNAFGHPGKPRATVPNKVYTAGDYVEIHGDGDPAAIASPYTGVFNPRGLGTPEEPIWFVGVDRPVFTNVLHIGWSDTPRISYLVFDGLEWRGGGRPTIRPKAAGNSFDHIVWRDCKAIGTGTVPDGSGFTITGGTIGSQDRVEHVVWHGGEIASFGDKNAPGEECCVYVSRNVSYFWLLDAAIHDAAEDGMQFSHAAERTSDHLFVGRNRIYENLTDPIDIKATGKVVVFSENEIWGHRDVWVDGVHKSTGSGAGATFHYSGDSSGSGFHDNYPEEIWFIFNRMRDGRQGVGTSSCGYLGIIGNTFYQTRRDPSDYPGVPPAIDLRNIRGNTWILHNTIHDCEGGIRIQDYVQAEYDPSKTYYGGYLVTYEGKQYVAIYSSKYPDGMTGVSPAESGFWMEVRLSIFGNIISEVYGTNGARDVAFNDAGYFEKFTDWGANCIYNPANNGPNLFNVKLGPGDLTSAPRFVNASVRDFRLSEGSPCIDSGARGGPVDAYAFYKERVGVEIRVDQKRTARPQGPAWDIGAFEFAGEGSDDGGDPDKEPPIPAPGKPSVEGPDIIETDPPGE